MMCVVQQAVTFEASIEMCFTVKYTYTLKYTLLIWVYI